MTMTDFLLRIRQKLFGAQLDFRARLFNILGAAGVLASLAGGVVSAVIGAGLFNVAMCAAAGSVTVWVLWYSAASGKYQFCYLVVIILIFMCFFPAIYLTSGGYRGGMPLYFVFAVLFTVFMLEGKRLFIMAGMELALYVSLFLYAYYKPEKIQSLNTESDVLIDILVSFLVVSVWLGLTMFLHFRLYDRRQRELEAARRQVEEYAKMKGELFVGMSHEMRTPLTVMSTYAQYAVEQLRESGADEQTLADLATISDEAKRLAEMADGTLKVLISSSILGACETEAGGVQKYSPVDVGAVCSRLVKLLEPIASRKGMKLSAVIGDNIPSISGDADNLTQLVWNILQNAITHSEGKSIELTVEASDGVTVTVNDDGTGIDAEILPRVFERGVSGKKGGIGIGLAICLDIVKLYGGTINIESAIGAGTKVTVILRGVAENGGVNV